MPQRREPTSRIDPSIFHGFRGGARGGAGALPFRLRLPPWAFCALERLYYPCGRCAVLRGLSIHLCGRLSVYSGHSPARQHTARPRSTRSLSRCLPRCPSRRACGRHRSHLSLWIHAVPPMNEVDEAVAGLLDIKTRPDGPTEVGPPGARRKPSASYVSQIQAAREGRGATEAWVHGPLCPSSFRANIARMDVTLRGPSDPNCPRFGSHLHPNDPTSALGGAISACGASPPPRCHFVPRLLPRCPAPNTLPLPPPGAHHQWRRDR